MSLKMKFMRVCSTEPTNARSSSPLYFIAFYEKESYKSSTNDDLLQDEIALIVLQNFVVLTHDFFVMNLNIQSYNLNHCEKVENTTTSKKLINFYFIGRKMAKGNMNKLILLLFNFYKIKNFPSWIILSTQKYKNFVA